ncbi:hypothetical protein CI109_102512 [Kwoniella shandongensis]|uniref:Uncharacterized protein n=1 Tax=Kwoniella shandongensis TaxID=1734106 RepID=A0A5M6C333_9TREE|nr:uncharacterized protein CI109_003170 [Kwoniella shandongensis]KAA5528272.1 hypothetical protein CI109_003170 [Kwoniella shandongensis]
MTSTKPRSTEQPPRPPATPPPPPPSSQAQTSSPPSSPASTLPVHSDDDAFTDLSNSWMEVDSSVGASTLGDISDTSSDSHDQDHESRSHFSASTDGEDSDIDEHDQHHDAVVITGSPSLMGGEYTDAEASTSKLGSSMDTIQQGLAESTSSSQIRLIFPDPAASFSTISGSLTEDTTPMDIHPFLQTDQTRRPRADTQIDKTMKYSPRRSSSPVRRGVEGSWLHSSSKLWEIPPSAQSIIAEGHGYEILSSIDDIKRSSEDHDAERTATDVVPADVRKLEKEDMDTRSDRFPMKAEVVKRLGVRTRSSNGDEASTGSAVKKWMSVFALTSVLSLALYRTLGPSALLPPYNKGANDPATAAPTTPTPAVTHKPFSIWDHLPLSPLAATSLTSSSADSAKTTGVIADLQLIKQALSTLSTPHSKGQIPPAASTTDVPHKRVEDSVSPPSRHLARSSTSCCSVSIRNNDVALTVSPENMPINHRAKARKWSRKLLRAEQPEKLQPENDTSAPTTSPGCSCSFSTAVRSEVAARLQSLAKPVKTYALISTHYLDYFFGPFLAALDKELGDLLRLAIDLGKFASYTSQTVLSQASRGAVVSQAATRSMVERVHRRMSNFFSVHNPAPSEESLARIQAMLDNLSHYVEARLDSLSEIIEDRTDTMQEKGMESIKKAKKGLNKLITEAKRLGKDGADDKVVHVKMDVEKDGPLPFRQMGSRRQRQVPRTLRRKSGRGCKAAAKETKKKIVAKTEFSFPPPEVPSRARRIFDMIHHAAVALVV